MNKKFWLITQKHIELGDIESALLAVDPEQLSNEEAYGLHGMVRLRIENARGPADIFMRPTARSFDRKLHARWPYMGYFLRLAPVTEDSPFDNMIDLSLFLSLCLCHCDSLEYCESKHGIGLQFEPSQLSQILVDVQGRATELAQALDFSPESIAQRDVLITR